MANRVRPAILFSALLQTSCVGQPVTYATAYPGFSRSMGAWFPRKESYDPLVPSCTTHPPGNRVTDDQVDYACFPSNLTTHVDTQIKINMRYLPHAKIGFIGELISMCHSDKQGIEPARKPCVTPSADNNKCAEDTSTAVTQCVQAVARQAIEQCTYLTGRQNHYSSEFTFWLLAAQILFSGAADVAAIRNTSAATATLAGALTSVTVANSANIQKTFPPTTSFKIEDAVKNFQNYVALSDITEQDLKQIDRIRQSFIRVRNFALRRMSYASQRSDLGAAKRQWNSPYPYYFAYDEQHLPGPGDKDLSAADLAIVDPAGLEMASALKFSLLHDAVMSSCPAINP